ncbi:NAD(P)/FAD-dependent oxidoreductase [Bacillus sp. 2205SS5-2]|uniref:NAD(P)/FAD-dependent oxidoreductase n=1 Tax=Bacillus sp. 2205SS5-2 TaxID=3109031 RepID=UPI003004E82A
MNLKSGKLFWPSTMESIPKYGILDENIGCDVLIIGGGMSGAFCSYFLSGTPLNVVLVERRGMAKGSTCANTGLLQFANDKALYKCIQSFGIEKGVRHYQLCKQALETLQEDIIPNLKLPTDFIPRKSLYFASDQKGVVEIEKEYEMLKKYGFPATLSSYSEKKNADFLKNKVAFFTEGDAEVNPFKLAHSLLHFAHQNGVKTYEHTEINGKQKEKDGWIFHTKSGHRIKTKKVIYSLGYEAMETVVDSNAVIESSYAITTNKIGNVVEWPDQALIWETARPYFYARRTIDERIIIGGLDEPTKDIKKRDSMLPHKTIVLLQTLEEWFPSLKGKLNVEYSWSAFFGSTHNGLPMIGRYSEYPDSYFLLGYGGNGTVYSIIFAKILKEILMNGTSEDLNIYVSSQK